MYVYVPTDAISIYEIGKRAVAHDGEQVSQPETPQLIIPVKEVLDELTARRREPKTFVVSLDILLIDLVNHYIIAQPTGSTGVVRIDPVEESITLSSTEPLSD